MSDLCLNCTCPAVVEVITGENLCQWCYEHAPTLDTCPNCSSAVESSPVDSGTTPAPVSSRPGAGDNAASPSLLAGGGSPLPRPSLLELCDAVAWCAHMAKERGDDRNGDLAQRASKVLFETFATMQHYRTRTAYASDDPRLLTVEGVELAYHYRAGQLLNEVHP